MREIVLVTCSNSVLYRTKRPQTLEIASEQLDSMHAYMIAGEGGTVNGKRNFVLDTHATS